MSFYLPMIFWTEFFRVLLAPQADRRPRRSAEIIDFHRWQIDHPRNGRAA